MIGRETDRSMNSKMSGSTFSVLLGLEQEPAEYSRQFESGITPDRYPYGLETVPKGVNLNLIHFGTNSPLAINLARILRKLCGFDIASGLWRSRDIARASVIYAHTEREYLAAALALLVQRNHHTILIGQTIWLWDDWPRLFSLKKKFLHTLLSRVDIFIYNALPNMNAGMKVLPEARHEYVPFGVSSQFFSSEVRVVRKKSLIVSVGNDIARDWRTLERSLGTLRSSHDLNVRVATNRQVFGSDVGTVGRTKSIDELIRLYDSAAVVVVPIKDNLHASGITVLLEAAARGCAIIASKTGGLDSYFSDDEIRFIDVGDSCEMTNAIADLLSSPEQAQRLGSSARRRAQEQRYDVASYWRRVCNLIGF